MHCLQPHQTRRDAPSNYELALAAELESAYRAGAYELGDLTAALNVSGLRPPSGSDWTPDTLTAELARVGGKEAGPAWQLDPGPRSGLTIVDTADELLTHGLRDQWYALCPAGAVRRGELVRLNRVGESLLLWRDAAGEVHVQRDRCPHRSAPLSQGVHLGDRVACNYHGVQVDGTGKVVSVPGSPGCALEGRQAVMTFPACERAGAIFAWITETGSVPTPLELPEQLTSDEWENFPCYVEWDAPYQLSLDNVMDPMHGAFLHRESHSMSFGKREAAFQIRDAATGFLFEKTDQKSVNFDWVEWIDNGYQAMRLDIPYPESAGPGGAFAIIAMLTPTGPHTHAAFFWRCRKVSGWQRDSWRFLYRVVLEERHWHVLEQDRAMIERMPRDAVAGEGLYQHDIALVRVRRLLRRRAEEYLRERAKKTGVARARGTKEMAAFE
ncbi:recombinase-like helix-turn-helix domain-containing protein [Amycolatopsis sp. NPDC005232]|uniref:recombinase-like helix-turn-helix domain-containing protein n=1 Tax=Amycolatopsis sp. NPDC005232 TaxID=3157027 RepID=UPI0033BC4B69